MQKKTEMCLFTEIFDRFQVQRALILFNFDYKPIDICCLPPIEIFYLAFIIYRWNFYHSHGRKLFNDRELGRLNYISKLDVFIKYL